MSDPVDWFLVFALIVLPIGVILLAAAEMWQAYEMRRDRTIRCACRAAPLAARDTSLLTRDGTTHTRERCQPSREKLA